MYQVWKQINWDNKMNMKKTKNKNFKFKQKMTLKKMFET